MTEKANKPSIRFKGFTDAWEQRKLGEVAIIQKGQQLGKAEMSVVGTYYVLNGGMEPSGYTDQYNTSANTISISEGGNSCGFVALNLECFWSGGHNYTLQNPKIDTIYLYQWLKRQEKLIMALRVGSGLPNIQKSSLQDVEVVYPSNVEQRAIAAILLKIDNLITLHQRKYDKLVNVKKSLLEKMFPSNNERVPKIRFKGFTDTWEQRKLGDIVKITMGQSPDGSTYSDIPSKYILVQGNADLENGWVKPRIWTTQATKKAEAGDLIMSVRAPAGSMGKTAYNVVLGRGVAGIKGNEYIFQLLVKMDSDGYWKTLSAGSTFESLNSDSIAKAEVYLPNEQKQEHIGEFLKHVDNLITLHQRKLEKLKNIKKSLLEKMFV